VPSDEIRRRIAARTRAMFERGVEEEVRAALRHPISGTAARIHGLQDVTALLAGEIDRDEAIRRLDVRTRQYAKRQRVWMRRLPGLRPVAPDAVPERVAV
jgi:tRNA dimethylallyltransferase